MRYPKFLKDGGTIAVAAPSFGADTEWDARRTDNAVKCLQALGYMVDLGPNTYLHDGTGISNTPEKCAAELEEYYCSHGDVLISVNGGELMCDTIGKLNLKAIAEAEPKWFLGYSDNTNFGFLLPTLFDTASLYGPNMTDFGREPWHCCISDCLQLLRGKSMVSHGYDFWELEGTDRVKTPLLTYNVTEPTILKFSHWDETPVRGRFLGGCLDVLDNLCGTRFDRVVDFTEKYREDGIIWFLEACDFNALNTRRTLWMLKNAGWFHNAKAFLFGRPLRITDGPDYCGVDFTNAIESMLGEYQVPIIMDADFGHLPPAMTMINGGLGVLSRYGENNIQVQWETEGDSKR